jgi:hypothetical protein
MLYEYHQYYAGVYEIIEEGNCEMLFIYCNVFCRLLLF